jgi:molybdopterin synthase sulfur carrier subunit
VTTQTRVNVEVRVPSMLRAATAGEKVVVAAGGTIREVLEDLTRRYPAFGEGILTDDGGLREFVNVYVNDEDVRYLGKLEAPVRSGDTISILPAVAGGASVVRSELWGRLPSASNGPLRAGST